MTDNRVLPQSTQHIRLPRDTTSGALVTIYNSDHMINEGKHYFAVYSALKDNTGTIEVRFATPNTSTRIYMAIDVECAVGALVQMWSATTKTHVADNAIVPLNRDFNSSNASVLTLCHTPAGDEAAAASLAQYVGAATVSGKVMAGGEATSNSKFILKQNTAYLIRATSRVDGNSLSIILDWHED